MKDSLILAPIPPSPCPTHMPHKPTPSAQFVTDAHCESRADSCGFGTLGSL